MTTKTQTPDRKSLIAQVKQYGISTPRPPHTCSSVMLMEAIEAYLKTQNKQPKTTQRERILALASEGMPIKLIHERVVSEGYVKSNYRYVVGTLLKAGIKVPRYRKTPIATEVAPV
jgi:hypothetical protein